MRQASGVFHGAYVFACILRFFETYLLPQEQELVRRHFIEQRLRQIRDELNSVDAIAIQQSLTVAGQELFESVLYNRSQILSDLLPRGSG